jgi:hypothetical protein
MILKTIAAAKTEVCRPMNEQIGDQANQIRCGLK